MKSETKTPNAKALLPILLFLILYLGNGIYFEGGIYEKYLR